MSMFTQVPCQYICNAIYVPQIIVIALTQHTLFVISLKYAHDAVLVEETGVPVENHRPVVRYKQSLSHNVISSTPRHERDSNSQC
jgi:hypothetical protein